MKNALKIIGVLLMASGIIWAVTIVAAVAAQQDGFTSLSAMIPGLAFHMTSLFLGMVVFGLGQRSGKQAMAEVKA